RPDQGHAGVLPGHVPAEVLRRGGVGLVGFGDLRPQGRPAEEDLHAGAAPWHGGARAAALRRLTHRGGPAAQPRQAVGRRMTPERWQSAFSDYSNSSFSEYLRRAAPPLLPAAEPGARSAASEGGVAGVPHGTTVLAMRYRDGVVMAGDR